MNEEKTKIRVMVIDDDPGIRAVFQELFQRSQFDLYSAESGKKGLEEMQKQKYHIAFIDVCMPEMDGLETLRNLKRINPDVMAVMISGFKNENILEEALRRGAFGYLYKPLDIHDIFGVALKCSQLLGILSNVELMGNDLAN